MGFGLQREEPIVEIEVDITEEEDNDQNGEGHEINLEDLMVEEVEDHTGEHDDLWFYQTRLNLNINNYQ